MRSERWPAGAGPATRQKAFLPNGASRLPSISGPLAWEPIDTETASALYVVYRTAHLADEPAEPPESAGTYRSLLSGEWEGAPGEVWYLPGEHGVPIAYYRLDLPDPENTDRASVFLVTHPALRRQGAGRTLLRHAAERAAAHGRTVLEAIALEDSAGEAFARSAGARLVLEEARRVQELREVPREQIVAVRTEAERKSAGYSLMTWTGPVPDARAAQVAGVFNALADAPHAEGAAHEVWNADRIRRRTGRLLREGHLRGYSVAVVHDATGEMAGITEVVIDPKVPEWGYQEITAVRRPHRGHRLGMLVKVAMMQWLTAAEPRLERITTGNAADNEHMIMVNDVLGYQVTRPAYRYYEIPVSGAARVAGAAADQS